LILLVTLGDYFGMECAGIAGDTVTSQFTELLIGLCSGWSLSR
jgi:hypothetical protein